MYAKKADDEGGEEAGEAVVHDAREKKRVRMMVADEESRRMRLRGGVAAENGQERGERSSKGKEEMIVMVMVVVGVVGMVCDRGRWRGRER